jgi:hypothetical protein
MSSGMLRRVVLVRTDVSEERRSVRRLLVTASVVPSSPILVTLMMEAIHSSETSVFTRATRRNIPEHHILHSCRPEHPQSYTAILVHLVFTASGRAVWSACRPLRTGTFLRGVKRPKPWHPPTYNLASVSSRIPSRVLLHYC